MEEDFKNESEANEQNYPASNQSSGYEIDTGIPRPFLAYNNKDDRQWILNSVNKHSNYRILKFSIYIYDTKYKQGILRFDSLGFGKYARSWNVLRSQL